MARTMIEITPDFIRDDLNRRPAWGYTTGYARRQAAVDEYEKKREAESTRGQARKLMGDLMTILDELRHRWGVRGTDMLVLQSFIADGLPGEDEKLKGWTIQATAILEAAKSETQRQPLLREAEQVMRDIERTLYGSDFDDFSVQNNEGIAEEIARPLPTALVELKERIDELKRLHGRALTLRANERARQRAERERKRNVESIEFDASYAKLDHWDIASVAMHAEWAFDLSYAGVPGMTEIAKRLRRLEFHLDKLSLDRQELAKRMEAIYDEQILAERKLIAGKWQGGRAGHRGARGHRHGFDPDERRILRREARRNRAN